jgi:hypothetical protein
VREGVLGRHDAIPGTFLFPDPQCWWNANTYPAPWNFQLLSWIEYAGGNVVYTDAGSRYVTFDQNVSLANPVGFIDLGSCLTPSTWSVPLCAVTALNVSYGAEMGGCVPRGHLTYTDNWFTQPQPRHPERGGHPGLDPLAGGKAVDG